MNAISPLLADLLRGSTLEIFAHYGVALTPSGSSRALSIEGHDTVGVIGFHGVGLRGTLVIATSTGLVARTCPDTGGHPIPERDRVRDWIGELANLVLGRIKVELGRYGVSMGLSTPVAFTGEHLRLGAVRASRTQSWDFTSEAGDVRAWLETELGDDFPPLTTPEPRGDELLAGEPFLF